MLKKNCIACLLSISLAATALFTGGTSYAAETSAAAQSGTLSDGKNKYSAYSALYAVAVTPDNTVVIPGGKNFTAADGAEAVAGSYGGRDGVLIWKSKGGSVTWRFEMPSDGKYSVRLTYFSLDADAQDIELGLLLDGKTPFFEVSQLVLPKCFHSETEITKDKNGNDIRPKQIPYDEWITEPLGDHTGVSDKPYGFYLTGGAHTLTLTGALAGIAIEKIELYNEKEPVSYSEYSKGAKAAGNKYTKAYEAETPLYQSAKTLYPVYDRTSIDTSPSDPIKLRYNTIGQSNYSSHGQYIVWTVEAPEDGYYYLGARIRQNISTGTNSYRRLYVNGSVPFKEAESIKFEFNNRWQDYVFGGSEPWLIKLNKGENQLKLEVISGDMTEVIAELQELVTNVNELYREIIMITGASPDTYRDYHIDKEIKDFNERVKNMSDKAQAVFDRAVSLGNSRSGNFSAITKLKLLLDGFIKKPAEVPSNISTLSSYASGISGLMTTVKSQPLELDTITVSTRTDKLSTKRRGFWGNIAFQAKAFAGSFSEDYSSISSDDEETNRKIEVWVSTGRDQATVLKSLSDGVFTPKTGITANISIVAQSLIQASLSGMSPDVVLFVEQGSPVNLAMRGGLTPLSGFDTFKDVTARFQAHSMDAYLYNGDYYAIPVSESFSMMFYRTDIFESLNLTPPETWDDMYKIIRVLQQNNLTVGIPNADSSNVMAVDTGVFATLLYQRGEKYYTDDMKSTNFGSDGGIDTFNIWTEFYKDYGLPNQYNFLNRFRSGDMPIGLNGYTFYGMLKQTAPEIDGLWKMALIPGTRDKNGNINRSVCATGSCAVIMKGSRDKEAAWKYIEWITDTDAQSSYGQEMEALLGSSSRFTPANVKALSNLSWTYNEQQLIYSQWKDSFMLPQIPGSYIVDRNLISAFRKVVYSSANPRETIVAYNNTIENEILRKRKEFKLD